MVFRHLVNALVSTTTILMWQTSLKLEYTRFFDHERITPLVINN